MKLLNFLSLILGSILVLINIQADAIVFNMAPLEFTNRAGCAELSTKPAQSVFLQIDSFNAGKAGYAQGLIAKQRNPAENPSIWAKQSARDFRILSSHLAVDIMQALLKGKLPLLQQDGSSPLVYSKAVEKCFSKNQFLSCPAMNDLLSEMWSRSKMKNPNWQELGLTEDDFGPAHLESSAAIGCHVIRKFSGFQENLNSQKIQENTISKIALDTFRPEKTLDSCFATADGADPRFTSVQLDIANLGLDVDDTDWNDYGFQFWHSFKLFYSWAWRYAPEYTQEFGPFGQAFSSISFEDSVMLIPNGCRSVELPKCDSKGLSSDVMRAAAFLGNAHPGMGELPPRPIDSLFAGAAASVNNDILSLFSAESASSWSRDFKTKLSMLRFNMLRKLSTGMAQLQIITSLVSAKDLAKDINIILDDPKYDPIETHLACTEFTLAKNDLFQDIYNEIQTLNNNDELKSVMLADSSKNLKNFIDYYKNLTDSMTTFCKALEAKGRANSGTKDTHLLMSLNEWAFGILRPKEKRTYNFQCDKDPHNVLCPKNIDMKYLSTHPRVSNGTQGNEVVICKTSLECARIVLRDLVSVVSVRRYAHAFLPLDDIMKSPDLLNNYAQPTACHLYDPWKQERDAWKLFVADLGSALIQGATCGALSYNVLEMPKDNVLGFNQIVEQEQTRYSAEIEQESLKYIAGVDFGFLAGIACGATVANTVLYDPNAGVNNYWMFDNLQVRLCDGVSDTAYTIEKNAMLDPSFRRVVEINKDTKKLCFSCRFGLKSVINKGCASVPFIGQIAATGFGIFQGVIRLVSNLSDGDNMINNEKLNIDQISESFSDTSIDLEECHRQLKDGITCSTKNKVSK